MQNTKTFWQRTIVQLFLWYIIFLFSLVLSTFLHECAHGFSFAISGQPVSTGFNRVGNFGMYPSDPGFRTGMNYDHLFDLGVPLTLIFAIIFSLMYRLHSFKKPFSRNIVYALAISNSFMRLIPAGLSILIPILTGSPHIEDEVGTGLLLVKSMQISAVKYLPILVSIIISIGCLILIKSKPSEERKATIHRLLFPCFALAYISSFILLNLLDNVIRINWAF